MPTSTFDNGLTEQAWLGSVQRSQARIQSVLSIPCPQCGAAKGSHCWDNAHGFCQTRWDKGADLLRFPGALDVGELAPAAQVIRNVALHTAQRRIRRAGDAR